MEGLTIDLMAPINRARRLLRGLRTKKDPIYRSLVLMLGNNPVWTKTEIARLAKAGYQECSTVYACVKEITEAAAGIPWILTQHSVSPDGKTKRIDDHPLLDLLRRPNPQEGGTAFTKNALAYYLIAGNAYLVKFGPVSTDAPPQRLYTMRPDRVKVITGSRFEPIGGYRYTVDGVPRKPDFKPNEVLHLKAFHPLDDWYGLSPIEVAAKEIDISSMARDWNMKLLQNDCKPPGAFTTEGSLDEEQRTTLKKIIRADQQGYENVGSPLILEGGLSWEPYAITPKDMDHFNSDRMTLRKICAVYNVAPELIGDTESKTFANYKEARKALYLEAVMPQLDYLRDEYNNWVTPAFGDRLWLDYDRDSIEAIREELSAVYERMAAAWWFSINERRIACGKAEIKGGDAVFVPSNLTPLSDISGNIKEE